MPRIDFRRADAMIFAVAAYFALCVALRVFISPALEVDEGEQAFVSQFLALGYGPQPPFYNWLQYAVFEIFGVSLTALTVLKHLLLFLCCMFYGFAARIIIKNRSLAAMAMLGLLTLPPIFLLAQRDLSHTVSALFAVSLFLYGFFKTLRSPSLFSYLLTGIAVGIGLISKYNFALIPAAAVLAVLPERDLRQRIFDWRMIASLAVAFAIVLPHAYWIVHNLTSASASTIHEMKEGLSGGRLAQAFSGTGSLISAIFGASILPLVFFGAVFPFDIKRIGLAESQWTRITGRMIVLCLVAVLLIVLGLGATHIREKWLALFIMLLPLYLCLKIDAAGIETTGKLKRFAIPLFHHDLRRAHRCFSAGSDFADAGLLQQAQHSLCCVCQRHHAKSQRRACPGDYQRHQSRRQRALAVAAVNRHHDLQPAIASYGRLALGRAGPGDLARRRRSGTRPSRRLQTEAS
jgi:4-amino-4-deoxy-L-arabinose transferase-like glycosyltransferase